MRALRVAACVVLVSVAVSACGPETDVIDDIPEPAVVATEAGEPTTIPPTDEPEPTEAVESGVPELPAESVAGVEFATCEQLIAEGEEGLGAEFAVGLYAGILQGILDGEPIDGEVVELTDSDRATLEQALDVITEGDTYCGVVPVEEISGD